MSKEFLATASPEETEEIGAVFSRTLDEGSCVALVGELGAGKTRFVKGIAKGLGARGLVKSPTFTIINVYGHGRLTLYHADLYRLSSSEEALEVGLEEFIYARGVCVIEWADRAKDLLPEDAIWVRIFSRGGDERTIEIERP